MTPTADTNDPGSQRISVDQRDLSAQTKDGAGHAVRILEAEDHRPLSTTRVYVRRLARPGGNPRRDAGDATRAAVPHMCHTDSLTMLAHGDSRAVEDAVDLRLRR